MTEESWKVQVSLSSPPAAQYHKGSMANFRGDTVEEVAGQLQAARDLGLLELATEVEAIWLVNEQLGGKVESVQQNSSSQSEHGATVTQLRTCAHGKREYKSGGGGNTGKKPWAGYFCPEKIKANQCDVDWVRD